MNSSFRGREEVWQYYSRKSWERIVKNCESGLLEVRADLNWFYEFLRAKKAVKAEFADLDYSEIIQTLKPYSWARLLFTAAAFGLGGFGIFNYVALKTNINWLPWAVDALALTAGWNIFYSHMRRVSAEPKDLPLVWVYLFIFTLCILVFYSDSVIVFSVFFLLAAMLTSNIEYWNLRTYVLQTSMSNYDFFKQVSGRPIDCDEYPPLLILKNISEELVPVPWDVHPDPSFTFDPALSLSSVIYGKRFDIFFSKMAAQIMALLIAIWSALAFKELSWISIAVSSAGMTFLYTFVCPSWHYIDYVMYRERNRRINKTFDLSDTKIKIQWLIFNTVKSFVCIGIMAYIIDLAAREGLIERFLI